MVNDGSRDRGDIHRMSPPLGPPTLVCFGSKFAAKRAKTDGARCNGGLLPITYYLVLTMAALYAVAKLTSTSLTLEKVS